MREMSPDTDTTGQPKYYGHFSDESFILSPIPDANYATELHYKYAPAPISSIVTTTWLGDNADTALLYGCLVEAYTFMKGEAELIGLYDSRYKEALQGFKKLGEYDDHVDWYRNGAPPAQVAARGLY